MSHSVTGQVSFVHVVFEGTPYEVGRQQGEELKKVKEHEIVDAVLKEVEKF